MNSCCGGKNMEWVTDVRVVDGSIEKVQGTHRLECGACGHIETQYVEPNEHAQDIVDAAEWRVAHVHRNRSSPRPETIEDTFLTHSDVLAMLRSGGTVWAYDFSGDADYPDYPIEDLNDYHWIMDGRTMTEIWFLNDHRMASTIEWDEAYPDLLESMVTDWRRNGC
jgi:hypothetical protein